ncbi:MAG: NADP-dependent phosphogluconate dehydrogenase [Nanoarchaeota archaeon]|nr:NADP-dependent phosphogluconate dehydrogenase [Nanoarchaeota archaeon]
MGEPNMAMIGMDVMGSNFAANFAENGYDIALFNRTDSKTEGAFHRHDGREYQSRMHPVTGEMKDLVDVAGPQGTYFFMVHADKPGEGGPTQAMIESLLPHLEPGAVVVDCANSYWGDTNRRSKEFEGTEIHFFGTGVSGGEEGARNGPSIMPGGTSREVYNERLKKPLEDVAAKAPQDGVPCVTYIGDKGAGHFVKMVHNGIEYGDMALISEAYALMKAVGMETQQIGDVFAKWNEGKLESYLIEITADVLHQEDSSGEGYLVDKILDRAMMKGTGTWTVMSSLGLPSGVESIPTIYAAVASRAMSSQKAQRVEMSKVLSFSEHPDFSSSDLENRQVLLDSLENALYVAKISSYTQGIALMQEAAKQYDFGGLDIAEIAKIWRDGCIIRADFLGDITEAYKEDSGLISLVQAPFFKQAVESGMENLDTVCAGGVLLRVPTMTFDASRSYILQLTSAKLPANLIQAQRDFFGAHTFKRIDKAGNFHVDWLDPLRPEIKK